MKVGQFIAAAGLLLHTAAPAPAESRACPGDRVSVVSPNDAVGRETCDDAERALNLLAGCNIHVSQPITIEISEALPENCLGLFHCGDARIEILPAGLAAERRHPDSVFSALTTQEFSQSLLVHELVHAAFDTLPCPYRSCRATEEYVAYTMQIMSLSPDARTRVEKTMDLETKVSRDEISAMLLGLAPRRFIRKSWAHLVQRGDKCAYIDQIMKRQIIFDLEGP